jgi:hypothetical protein
MKNNRLLLRILSRSSRFIMAMAVVTILMSTTAYTQTYANPHPVPLLTAETFGALAYSGITGSATIDGDGGTSTAAIDAGIIFTGTKYGVGHSYVLQAQIDLAAALTDASERTNDATIVADALGGLTLERGVYGGGALDLASGATLTLNGSSTDIFILKAASTLTINSGSTVLLTGGAVWSNVFWYVGSSSTTISGATFNGIIIAVASITLNGGATSVTAKLLAHSGAVTINSDVLPVELTLFTARLNNNSIELNWKTATEVNNYGFEIERGENNSNFEKIGFVKGNGNSNSPKEYLFVDNETLSGNYSYRLKQIDNDGVFDYSKVVSIDIGLLQTFELAQNYPNPFNPTTKITYSIPVDSRVELLIYGVTGELVKSLVNEEQTAGIYTIEFDASGLSSGTYFYKIIANDFFQIKKMSVLK